MQTIDFSYLPVRTGDFVLDLSQIQGGKMLNEMILTTTLCLTIVGAMALFYGEMKLLKNSH